MPIAPLPFLADWMKVVRDKVNLDGIETRSKRPIRLLAAGPWAGELIAVLEEGRMSAEPVIRPWDSTGQAPPHDAALRGVFFAASAATDSEPDIARCVALGVPVFVLDRTASTTARIDKPGDGTAGRYSVTTLDAHELLKFFVPDVVDACGDNDVALACALPVFRPTVAAKLTVDCALLSLKIAGASALADHVPILGIVLGGIASAGDTIAITALQMNMLMHIAAAYGRRPDAARLVELLPVVGGGYAWRALARELSGFIPVAGIAVKAAIAYAGTLIVGQAAAYFYETGTPMGSEKTSAAYREAVDRAKKLMLDIAGRIRPKQDARN